MCRARACSWRRKSKATNALHVCCGKDPCCSRSPFEHSLQADHHSHAELDGEFTAGWLILQRSTVRFSQIEGLKPWTKWMSSFAPSTATWLERMRASNGCHWSDWQAGFVNVLLDMIDMYHDVFINLCVFLFLTTPEFPLPAPHEKIKRQRSPRSGLQGSISGCIDRGSGSWSFGSHSFRPHLSHAAHIDRKDRV